MDVVSHEIMEYILVLEELNIHLRKCTQQFTLCNVCTTDALQKTIIPVGIKKPKTIIYQLFTSPKVDVFVQSGAQLYIKITTTV